MITKTNKFRVRVDTPWVLRGEIVPVTFIKSKKVPEAPTHETFCHVFGKTAEECESRANDLVYAYNTSHVT